MYGADKMQSQLELQNCGVQGEEGEPEFKLLARDPLAPFLVAMWAALRKGDTPSALALFSDCVSDAAYNYRHNPSDRTKVTGASEIAKDMNDWREGKGLEVFGLHTVS